MIENDLETYEDEYIEEVLKGGFHKTPTCIGMVNEYLQWCGTTEYRIWEFLRNSIIRGKLKKDPLKLYTNYYLKGILATSWSERKLEEKLGTNRRNIRRYIKDLENKGFIQVDKKINPYVDKLQNIYILGTVTMDGLNNVETLSAYKLIWEKSKKNVDELITSNMSEFYDDDINFSF